MYSFVLRTHQKIDRAAYKSLDEITGISNYLNLTDILRFEGSGGPDAVRLKKTGSQPKHFYNPAGDNDKFIKLVEGHYQALVKELVAGDKTRAAFEAAWLAHALVDGLTPAHHFPYEDMLAVIHGDDKSSRKKVLGSFVARGSNRRESARLSLQLIGPRGLVTQHTAFEFAAGVIALPINLMITRPLLGIGQFGSAAVIATFKMYADAINRIHIFERFCHMNWTLQLGSDIRRQLIPRMVDMVALAWRSALVEADLALRPAALV